MSLAEGEVEITDEQSPRRVHKAAKSFLGIVSGHVTAFVREMPFLVSHHFDFLKRSDYARRRSTHLLSRCRSARLDWAKSVSSGAKIIHSASGRNPSDRQTA